MLKTLIIILLLFVGCGKTTSPYDEAHLLKFTLKQEGYFRASLIQLNRKFTGRVKGKGSFFINSFQFYSKVSLRTSWREVMHLQMVHMGSECPSTKDDINRDGVLDGVEALSVVGGILLPLDLDLTSQMSKFTVYPITNNKGRYVYAKSISSSLLMQDLWERDLNVIDFISKLEGEDELNLSSRVLMIYGIPEYKRIPSSALGFEGFSPHLSLPIACAKIQETNETFP